MVYGILLASCKFLFLQIGLYTELSSLREPLRNEKEETLAKLASFLPKYYGLKKVQVGEKSKL